MAVGGGRGRSGAVGGGRGPSGAVGGRRGPSGAVGGRRGPSVSFIVWCELGLKLALGLCSVFFPSLSHWLYSGSVLSQAEWPVRAMVLCCPPETANDGPVSPESGFWSLFLPEL